MQNLNRNQKFRTALVLVILCLIYVGCTQKKAFDHDSKTFEYNRDKLQNAWKNNDSLYVKNWIVNLDKLKFVDLADRAADFQYFTNFCYGYIETEGNIEKTWAAREKRIYVRNVYTVHCLYLNSCLFMNKKVDKDSTLFIQEKFWDNNKFLSAPTIFTIENEMKKICNRSSQSDTKR